MSTANAALEVRLDAFEGPIELLLELISARRLEIDAVSVAQVVDDYLEAVAHADELDLDTASRFLLVAATLLHIKTRRLLPVDEPLEVDDDLLADAERDVLLARLLAARTFKDVADVLQDAIVDGSRFVPRSVQPEEAVRRVAPDLLRQVTAADLARIAAAALAERPEPDMGLDHVQPLTVSVRDVIMSLLHELPARRETTLRELCAGRSLQEAIARVLAILELLRSGLIGIHQDEPLDDIRIDWRGDGVDVEALDVTRFGDWDALPGDPGDGGEVDDVDQVRA